MKKYGRKNTISKDLSNMFFGLLGEPGVGKTTTIFHIAEKLFGEDGYMVLDMGTEFGTEYIQGINSEPVEDFNKFIEMTNDIIKNKEIDYPELKVLIVDTLDVLFETAEPYMVKLYNQENMSDKNFKPVKTINAVEGGFMHGQDRLIEIIVNQIAKLRRAGIGFWYTGHVKRRSTDDVFSGDSYDQLTTSMSQRYFSAIKNKTHVLGIAYVDRTLVQQEIGKENPITHKKKSVTRIASENIKVKFRDDSYTADSKSRLRYIVDEVNLNEHEIIKAIQDAIEEEIKNPYKATEKNTEVKTETEVVSVSVDKKATIILNDEEQTAIRNAFQNAGNKAKDNVKDILVNYGGKLVAEMNFTDVERIKEILGLI